MRVYQQVARLLADAGVTTVFGVMGDGNMHWVAAYREQAGCSWRPAWHEAGALWMADGYAAANGTVGVATVTMGPGLAQSLAALTTCVRTRRPVLLITADVPACVPAQAQQAEQRPWVEACGAHYLAVRAADELPSTLAAALAHARDGDVTVLAIDVDLFTAEANDPALPVAAMIVPALSDPAPVPTGTPELAAAVAAISRSRAPVLVLGRGAVSSGALDAALALGRRIGAAVATTLGGRVALDPDAYDLGVIGMMADPLTRAVAARADAIIVLGAALDRYNTDGGTLGRSVPVVRIDRRAPEQLWNPGPDVVSVRGDVAEVVGALLDRVAAPSAGLRTPGLRAELAAERARQDALASIPVGDGANPWAMVAALDTGLPADAHVVVGIGHFWYFAAPYLRPRPGRTFHFACGFGLIGQALPVAVGAALAGAEPGARRPVVAVEGDGSLPMNVQELQAAVRHGVDLLLVVLNNQAYGSEYHKLALAGLDVAGSEFDAVPFDVVAVARAMGAAARRADDPAELRDALAELVPARGVRVIDAHLSRSTMSEAYVRQHGQAGHHPADHSSH